MSIHHHPRLRCHLDYICHPCNEERVVQHRVDIEKVDAVFASGPSYAGACRHNAEEGDSVLYRDAQMCFDVGPAFGAKKASLPRT